MSADGDRGRIRGALRNVKGGLRDAKLSIERRFGLFGPLELVAYRSEGRVDMLRVRARVMERSGIRERRQNASRLRNMLNTLHRFESDEIPGARVAARFAGVEVRERTDREGFVEMEIRLAQPVAPGWHQVEMEILGSMAGGAGVTRRADVLVPGPAAEFIVVSDLDDTVIHTQATSFLSQARIVLTGNAQTIATMPGAEALYRAIEGGPSGAAANPFFYVSMSGWGLYDLFVDFLDDHGFPKGCLFLQDLALIEARSSEVGSPDHKRDTILRQMDTFPDLPFVLVGDSGQSDPETFRDIAREQPDRVRAVLVRDVTPPERDREVRRVVEEVIELGIPMAAAESSVSLARAAADFDLVPHSIIDDVRRAMIATDGGR